MANDKRTANKLVRAGGAVGASLIDAALEGYSVAMGADGTFPFVPTVEPLPPVDDFIVLGISGAAMALGAVTKNKMLSDVGEGMVLYSAPMIVHHTIVRASWMGQPVVAVQVASEDPRYRSLHRAPVPYGPGFPQSGYPYRPGLSDVIKYSPEQRIITAPKFTPGVLKPKFSLGA